MFGIKKLILTSSLIFLLASNCFGATITRFVNTASSGGNGTTNDESGVNAAYVSLNAWEAAEGQDLTDGGGDIMIVNCSTGSGTAADTSGFTFNGFTTAAANYVEVVGESSSGAFDSNLYRLAFTDVRDGIRLQDNYVRFRNLQFDQTQTTETSRSMRIDTITGSADIQISHTIFQASTVPGGSNNSMNAVLTLDADITITISNCIFYGYIKGTDNDFLAINFSTVGTANVYNSTLEGNRRGVQQSTGTVNVTNSAVFNHTSTEYVGTVTRLNCANDDTNSHTGEVDLNDNAGNEWTDSFTDYTTNDYTVKDTSSLVYNAGTDLSGVGVADDIIGTARPQSTDYDIGAFEFIVAAGARRRIWIE